MFINHVKNYLEVPGHSLETLKTELGISSRIYNAKHGDLVIFAYSQIDSPKTNPIVRMCRGLVLEKDTWDIVSFPFYRFYNFEEVPEERIKFDWKHSYATEKIDGSLLEIFNYKGEWLLSTRSMIGGDNALNAIGTTVNDIFNDAIKPLDRFQFFSFLNPNYTYIFEIVSPYNQIVTQWDTAHLYLIGGRNIQQEEIPFTDIYSLLDSRIQKVIRLPKVISLYDAEKDEFIGFDKMKHLAETGNSQDEGFVVVYYNSNNDQFSFPRVKVKNSAYVALHHLRGTLDNGVPQYARMLCIVYNNEVEEVLSSLPFLKSYFNDVTAKWERFKIAFNAGLELVKDDLSQSNKFIEHPELKKDFAMKVQKTKFSSLYFFMLKFGLQTLDEFIDYQLNHSVPIFDKLWENQVSKY